jgi:hypothetical protein
MTRMTRPPALLAALLAALAPAPALATEGRTIIDQRLAEQNLCAGLQTEQFGQTIGINELEDVELREADLSLRGDRVTASFAGRLSCRTPEGALLAGNASAAIAAEARIRLDGCEIESLGIEVSDFEGTFGPILGTFAPQIEEALAGEAEPLLIEACQEFSRP